MNDPADPCRGIHTDQRMFPKNPKPDEEFRQKSGRVTVVWRHKGNGNWTQVRTEVERTDFERDWEKVARSAPHGNARKLTGHDQMSDPSMRPDPSIQAMKDRVFGTRTGQTEMFWLHATKGMIVLPAEGDTTHRMVEENPSKYTKDEGIVSALKEKSSLLAFGRVEHRAGKGWVHVVSLNRPSASTIRTIRRRYPNHAITDGHGREIVEGCDPNPISRGMKTYFEFMDSLHATIPFSSFISEAVATRPKKPSKAAQQRAASTAEIRKKILKQREHLRIIDPSVGYIDVGHDHDHAYPHLNQNEPHKYLKQKELDQIHQQVWGVSKKGRPPELWVASPKVKPSTGMKYVNIRPLINLNHIHAQVYPEIGNVWDMELENEPHLQGRIDHTRKVISATTLHSRGGSRYSSRTVDAIFAELKKRYLGYSIMDMVDEGKIMRFGRFICEETDDAPVTGKLESETHEKPVSP